jgi:hypothetical protein
MIHIIFQIILLIVVLFNAAASVDRLNKDDPTCVDFTSMNFISSTLISIIGVSIGLMIAKVLKLFPKFFLFLIIVGMIVISALTLYYDIELIQQLHSGLIAVYVGVCIGWYLPENQVFAGAILGSIVIVLVLLELIVETRSNSECVYPEKYPKWARQLLGGAVILIELLYFAYLIFGKKGVSKLPVK